MRKVEYLSPTAIALYYSDPEAYYLKYLSVKRPPREPQNAAMAVGSAFDAYVKAYLHEAIFGKGHDPKFEFTALFEAQVEPQNRKVALEDGGWCFEWYRRLGAVADLLLDLNQSVGKPRFEIDLRGVVSGVREGTTSEIVGVPFNGKPDCFFISKDGAHVILDWKVNGFYSKSAPSPVPGYVKLREDGKLATSHKDCKLETRSGVTVNVAKGLEELDADWARQLTIYSVQTGQEIGSEFIARIEQLVCKAAPMGAGKPKIRVASHSLLVSPTYQQKVFDDARRLWEILNPAKPEDFHFFTDLPIEDSRGKCALLEKRAETVYGDNMTEQDKWFADISR